ncbi:MAG: hypothetical protein COW65_11815, partial [Cytophagales bacterium CG18_big_fil_WC_8_21_14_2_50_42_9]
LGGMYQSYLGKYPELTEDDVIHYVTIDDSNAFSVQANIGYMRENARGARDRISSELWEAINVFYHDINSYSAARLQYEGMHHFSHKVEVNSAVIKGYIDNTLIRNEAWILISLGIHLERAIQVALIMLNKVYDIAKLDAANLGGPVESYQWAIMLKSAESFDMYKRYYLKKKSSHSELDFLLFNKNFPKSLTYNLRKVQQNIQKIAFHDQKGSDSIEFKAGKIASQFQYLTIGEVEESIAGFLNETVANLNNLAAILEQKYLCY